MKTRLGRPKIENPDNLFDVARNILAELEQRVEARPGDTFYLKSQFDLVNQALLALLTLIEHEHDQRKQASLDRGPRIGG